MSPLFRTGDADPIHYKEVKGKTEKNYKIKILI